jgi:hypothetical protein
MATMARDISTRSTPRPRPRRTRSEQSLPLYIILEAWDEVWWRNTQSLLNSSDDSLLRRCFD